MNHEADFNQEMKKLIKMVRKFLNHCLSQDRIQDKPESVEPGSLNVNVFIFPFLSLSSEEMDEWEEIYDTFFFEDSRPASEEFSTDLTNNDRDFLRRHGISF